MDLDGLVARAPQLVLLGRGFVLRRFTAADVPMAFAQEQDRAIMRWIRDPRPPELVRAQTAQWVDPWRGEDGEWLVLTLVPDGEPGGAGLVVCRVTAAEHATMEIGYRLEPRIHGRGLGIAACRVLCTFLFGVVRVRKLVAYSVAANEPSSRLLRKLGMQREACLREHSFIDGAWRDELVHGLLAREWHPPVTA